MDKKHKTSSTYQDHFPETHHPFLSDLIILHETNQSLNLEVSAPSTEQLTVDFKRLLLYHFKVLKSLSR